MGTMQQMSFFLLFCSSLEVSMPLRFGVIHNPEAFLFLPSPVLGFGVSTLRIDYIISLAYPYKMYNTSAQAHGRRNKI